MSFSIHKLPNGITVVHKKTHSDVIYCGMTVGAGTRHEASAEHGIAHLLEHMLFKGTSKRKVYHINSLLDNVGGELNAFTTKEETVVHATVLRRDFVKAVDLISDVLFHSTFPNIEIEKERGVIIDEINSYKDSPGELIFDDFEDMLFNGCSLGRNILGSPRSLKKMNADSLREFQRRCYSTDAMVFSVVGNISFRRVQEVCDKFLGPIEATLSSSTKDILPEYAQVSKTLTKSTYQGHYIMGIRAYDCYHPQRITLSLLVSLLGGASSSSRLNTSLRERHGLCYTVEANYTAYTDTGVASIYFGCSKENIDKCRHLIDVELDRLRTEELTPMQLSRAKKQLIGQLTIGNDSGESIMLAAARSYMLYGTVETIDNIIEKIESVTSGDIRATTNEIFAKDSLSVLMFS